MTLYRGPGEDGMIAQGLLPIDECDDNILDVDAVIEFGTSL